MDHISNLSTFVHWITSRDIHMDSISWWFREIDDIFFMLEKELPTSFMDLQVHILIHLPDEVELVGVIHWIFFLERYMKKLKGFVRQRDRPKGSMSKACIVYESFYYASEYQEN
jgi:hypothetical protein